MAAAAVIGVVAGLVFWSSKFPTGIDVEMAYFIFFRVIIVEGVVVVVVVGWSRCRFTLSLF